MMVVVPGNDSVDPFLNSGQVVKNVFSPLVCTIRKVAKDFANRRAGFNNEVRREDNDNGSSDKPNFKKVYRVDQYVISNDKIKGSPVKLPLDVFVGDCPRKSGSNKFGNGSGDAARNDLGEQYGHLEEDASSLNSFHFVTVWSLVDGFLQVVPSPFGAEKKIVQAKVNEVDVLNESSGQFSHRDLCEFKKRNNICEAANGLCSEGLKHKERNWFDCFVLINFDQLLHNLQKFGTGFEERKCEIVDSSSVHPPLNHFGHVDSLIKFLKGRGVGANGLDGNLKFARVQGVPSSVAGASLLIKNESNVELCNSVLHEENGGNSSDTSANGRGIFCSKEATVVSDTYPVEMPAESVLKSALAGAISCSFSAALMHPVDTVKTQVQATTITFLKIMSMLPQIGLHGVYKGSIPAILGQFTRYFCFIFLFHSQISRLLVRHLGLSIFIYNNHGLRTGICEASKLLITNVAPSLPDKQVESVASFVGALLGTASRIPSEVVKQRLQANQFDNVGEATVGVWRQDGLKGFFRGTGITLLREVPFYVLGGRLYAESKRAIQRLLGRELEPWEAVVVGAISGGLTAVSTTPFDVIKTRMMTASPGDPVSVSAVAFSIIRLEGPVALFRGAVPRFFWVAPLGAINFAGYELVRKALDKHEEFLSSFARKT